MSEGAPKSSDYRAGVEEWEEPLHLGSLPASYPTFPHNATLIAHFFPQPCPEAVKTGKTPCPRASSVRGSQPRRAASGRDFVQSAVQSRRVHRALRIRSVMRVEQGQREGADDRVRRDARGAVRGRSAGSLPRSDARGSRARSRAAAPAPRPARTPTPPGSFPPRRRCTSGAVVRPDGTLKTEALAAGHELTHQQNPYTRLLGVAADAGLPHARLQPRRRAVAGSNAGLFFTLARLIRSA